MSNLKVETLEGRKERAAKCAKQLGYSQDVVDRIVWAESIFEVDMIMAGARKGVYDDRREDWEDRPCIY